MNNKVNLRLGYIVGRLDRIIRQQIDACVSPHQLSVAQYTTLSILKQRSGLSNAQLARRAYVTPQAMNQVLAQLSQLGLIERASHETNARIVCLSLTVKGLEVLAACDASVDEMEQRMLSTIDAANQALLRQMLVSCVRSLGGGLTKTDETEGV
ncbi:MAG: MarR family transcriptional regulator [Anaerolineae bacterium]|nr:MarR family transcriptional regulator [Anaerolineae bacterium]